MSNSNDPNKKKSQFQVVFYYEKGPEFYFSDNFKRRDTSFRQGAKKYFLDFEWAIDYLYKSIGYRLVTGKQKESSIN